MEVLRRAGFRRVGGLYLMAKEIYFTCPRLPQPLKKCPHCGEGPNISRNMTSITPKKYFSDNELFDPSTECPICNPPEGKHYIMCVGKHFYPTTASFMIEAQQLGVSKRVPFLGEIVFNKTVIYLAHERASVQGWGLFAYFIPTHAEYLVWDNWTGTANKNFTLIKIPTTETQHAPYKERVIKPIMKSLEEIEES